MTRELISWLGLLSQEKHGIKLLSKFKIFSYLEQLIDADGYYDHLILLILNTFIFDTNFSMQPKFMVEHWSRSSSSLLSRNILEYFRLMFRNEY